MINENKRDIQNVIVIGFLQEKVANSKSLIHFTIQNHS